MKFEWNSMSHWSGANESHEIECTKVEYSVFKKNL